MRQNHLAHTLSRKNPASKEAVGEARLPPSNANRSRKAHTILDSLEEVCRHHPRFPTDAEWKLYARGKTDFVGFNSYRRQFGVRKGTIAALPDRAIEPGEDYLLENLVAL